MGGVGVRSRNYCYNDIRNAKREKIKNAAYK